MRSYIQHHIYLLKTSHPISGRLYGKYESQRGLSYNHPLLIKYSNHHLVHVSRRVLIQAHSVFWMSCKKSVKTFGMKWRCMFFTTLTSFYIFIDHEVDQVTQYLTNKTLKCSSVYPTGAINKRSIRNRTAEGFHIAVGQILWDPKEPLRIFFLKSVHAFRSFAIHRYHPRLSI